MIGKEYDDWENFGIRVKNSRNSIGMTTEKLAEKSDRTENFITRIENGKKSCSIHTLYQFCNSMKISSDSLLFGSKNEEEKTYSDKEVIENILSRCDEKQLRVIKDILISIYHNFNDLIK